MYISVVAQSFGVAARPQSAPFFCPSAPAKPCGQVRQMLNPRTFGRRPVNTPQSAREFDSKSAENREKAVKDDLSLRLKSVCNHLSKAEFAILVGDMTREQLRGERVPGRKADPC
jgi:hypothetical protein